MRPNRPFADRPFFVLWIFCLVLVASPGYSAEKRPAPKPKFRIGAILPLSGSAASLGQAAQNGITLALDSLPADERAKVDVIFEDDALKAANSVSAFQKLVHTDGIDALICWSSGTCNAIAPLAETAQIPVVAIASDAHVSKGRDFAVNLWVTPETQTTLILAEAKIRGYRRVAIITTIQDGSLACRDAFRAQAQGSIEIALDQEFAGDVTDFRTIMPRIAALKDLDAVLAILMPGQSGVFAKQLRAAGIQVPLFGYETFDDEGEIKVSAGGMSAAWFATAAPAEGAFATEYRRRFPGATLLTANDGFDGVKLLLEGSKGGANHAAVAKYLRTVKSFTGASGTFSATGDNRFTLPVQLKYVARNGTTMPLSRKAP